MLPKRIGIDLGTANVLVYVKGRGIVINEPSVVALANRDNTVVAVGREAQEMMGRVPGSISVIESVRVAGDRLDDAIVAYIKRRYNLVIGDRTAEEMKRTIGAAVPLDQELKMDIRGRDQISGLPKTLTVQTSDVTAAIQD